MSTSGPLNRSNQVWSTGLLPHCCNKSAHLRHPSCMKNTAPSYPITEPVTTTLDLGIPDAFCSNHATISTVRALHQQAAEKQKPQWAIAWGQWRMHWTWPVCCFKLICCWFWPPSPIGQKNFNVKIARLLATTTQIHINYDQAEVFALQHLAIPLLRWVGF